MKEKSALEMKRNFRLINLIRRQIIESLCAAENVSKFHILGSMCKQF